MGISLLPRYNPVNVFLANILTIELAESILGAFTGLSQSGFAKNATTSDYLEKRTVLNGLQR